MEKFLDFLGGALWLLSFIAPLIIIPIVWKMVDGNKVMRVIIGLILSLVFWWFLFNVGQEIIFRHGMGP